MPQRISIKEILEFAVNEGASDIHIKVGYPPMYRVEGNLLLTAEAPLDIEAVAEIAKAVLDTKYSILKDRGDVDSSLKVDIGQTEYRYRVHAATDERGLFLNFRVIPKKIRSIETLGFPVDKVWQDICRLKEGLVLVTGRTGSGKTTTIASLLQKINETRAEHIITLEDPIEYEHQPIKSVFSQREIGKHVESFEKGLEAVLRLDPNIISIGEIRSRETAYIALHAAGTGHLVFATQHTQSAPETVTQFAKKFPGEEQDDVRAHLASCLAYIISQQLIPYQGNSRTLAMEIMNVKDSDSVKTHIRESQDHQLLSDIQVGKKHGMISMDERLKELILGGINFREVLPYAHNSNELQEWYSRLDSRFHGKK